MPPETSAATRHILLVDDHPILRLGIRHLIEREPDLRVSGEAATVDAALELVHAERPDLAIVDLSLAGRSGLELLHEMRHRHPDVPVVVLSLHDEMLFAERALKSGARAYIMKSEAAETLVQTIRQVLAGKVVVGQRVSERVLDLFTCERPLRDGRLSGLSDREMEVFELVGRGLSTAAIAAELSVSVKTIETYRSNIKTKLHLADASELVRYATSWAERV